MYELLSETENSFLSCHKGACPDTLFCSSVHLQDLTATLHVIMPKCRVFIYVEHTGNFRFIQVDLLIQTTTNKTLDLNTNTMYELIRRSADWDAGSPTPIHLTSKWPSLVLLLSLNKANQRGWLSSQSREPAKHLALHGYLIRGGCRPG